MLPLQASIQAHSNVQDARSAARRMLRLEVPAHTSRDAANALIHNLSETGLLIETPADLRVGEKLEVDLPHAGPTSALVIWSRGQLFGCEFARPVSTAAISAALLRNPIEPSPARQPAPLANRPAERTDDPFQSGDSQPGQAVLIASLLLSLIVVLAFVLALLSFPFSTS